MASPALALVVGVEDVHMLVVALEDAGWEWDWDLRSSSSSSRRLSTSWGCD